MKTTSTPNGTGYIWDHRINDGTNQSYIGCQPTVYIRYTIQAFADLATLDSSLFDSAFMKRVANTMAHKVLKDTDGSYMTNNVCGGGGKYGHLYHFVSYPYSTLGRFGPPRACNPARLRQNRTLQQKLSAYLQPPGDHSVYARQVTGPEYTCRPAPLNHSSDALL